MTSDHEIAHDGATATPLCRQSKVLHAAPSRQRTNAIHHESVSARWLEKGDTFIYVLVGICFFLGAVFT